MSTPSQNSANVSVGYDKRWYSESGRFDICDITRTCGFIVMSHLLHQRWHRTGVFVILWWESRRWVVGSVKWRHGLVCVMLSGGKIEQTDPECRTERTCREPLSPKWIPVDVLVSLRNQLRVSDLCVFAVSASGLPCTENIRCGYLCVRQSAATCACQCQWGTSDSRYRRTAEFYRHGQIPPHWYHCLLLSTRLLSVYWVLTIKFSV